MREKTNKRISPSNAKVAKVSFVLMIPKENSIPEKLCTACGLCCNGVIFANVQLQASDDSARLGQLGLPTQKWREKFRFSQPCAALEGCRCKIYSARPGYCREFECALLKKVSQEKISSIAALKTIERARRRVEKIEKLLAKLGNHEANFPLAKRFRSVQKRFEINVASADEAELFAELSLAMHRLNLLLSVEFYPSDQK